MKSLLKKIVRWFDAVQPYLLLLFIPLLVASVVFSALYYSKEFLPFPAAEPGRQVVPLFNTTTIITGFTFFVTQILLFYFAYKFRSNGERKVSFLKSNLKLEISWAVIPALVFIFLFIWGQILWAKIHAEPEGEVLEVDVMAEQFSWWVRYPGKDQKLGRANFRYITEENDMGIDLTDPRSHDDFVPVQMHVPKNQTVKVYVRSRDVIHDFYIPHFRMKMDAVPGMVTSMHFTPKMSTREMREKLGDPDFNYEIACAEVCGRMHFAMKMILVVEEPEEFEQWYQKQASWLSKHPEYQKALRK
jgi:cytochrome c oxidase subunit II